MSRLAGLFRQVDAKGPALAADLANEITSLTGGPAFGLNFERRQPEAAGPAGVVAWIGHPEDRKGTGRAAVTAAYGTQWPVASEPAGPGEPAVRRVRQARWVLAGPVLVRR